MKMDQSVARSLPAGILKATLRKHRIISEMFQLSTFLKGIDSTQFPPIFYKTAKGP